MAADLKMEEFAWDDELRGEVQAVFSSVEHVLAAFYVEKSTSSWGIGGRRSRPSSQHRILALTVKPSPVTKKMKVCLHVVKESATGLKTLKVHKLSHLREVEGVIDDESGRTFILNFDLLQKHSGTSSEWSMRSVDDRNRLLISVTKLCKLYHGRTPKITGFDVVEMQLWAQKNAKLVTAKGPAKPKTSAPSKAFSKLPRTPTMNVEDHFDEDDVKDNEGDEETVEIDSENDEELISKDEEKDMDALLGMYVLGIDEADAFSERLKREMNALDDANVHAILENTPLVDEVTQELEETLAEVEDLEEWLGAINVKIRHMREDIASFETRNNRLETQTHNSNALLKELHVILDRFRVPAEYAKTLTAGTFEEAKVADNVEACKWLASAFHDLEPPFLEARYASMRAIGEKRNELEKLKGVFLGRATNFLRDYFSSIVESMISDKSSFSQKGDLRRPEHSDLRFKCRQYARLIQHMKALDKTSLQPLRKSFCLSLNHLLRREAREFANELRNSTVVRQTSTALLDRIDSGKSQPSPKESPNGASTVSDAYARMLRTFIPYLVDESTFFASFMCFEVQPLAPQVKGDAKDRVEEESRVNRDDIILNTPDQQALESKALREALQELLDGIQEDFYAVADWAHRVDPWSCISVKGVTEKYRSSHKADAAWFVHQLLDDLQVRISSHFNQVVAETSKLFERADRSQNTGVLYSITKFANVASFIESQIVGQNSREDIDAAFEKMAAPIFTVIENVVKNDPKNAEIFALDNYAAFQDNTYELAAVTPALEKFYTQASDGYAQACQQYAKSMINYQFERLLLFLQRVEQTLLQVQPEQVSAMPGCTKTDLRKMLRTSLSSVEKTLQVTFKRMQKQIQREDVLSTIWDQYFKVKFLEKYTALEEIMLKCYKDEALNPSSADMKKILDGVYSA
ncbi:exocyst complex component SEC3A [Physcomitrium patens]|uniref:Exocyst complex component Sec3 PIP2-binding N-terminal domain-containing protein n=1 Tax=Physcomitrium patens TaxID=3218 RepID=A0A2K1JUY4_PHYPA|nr:exocyst complex component SEC3A-like [Physcomitrium patens]XP_024388583.1 exocyst complex component SEC3A-like [Physcomitrium patens]PNR45330.1 hypothetical protein PHYPA_015101 [Physcomitrium patens]|eukprot:XP_024388582.1 exocyst complex component SEC3A-like [Physcomitrella patens]